MARITLEDINNSLEPLNWKCVTEEYKNLETIMVFLCPEGHKVHTTWKKLRSKQECPICRNNINKQMADIRAIPKKKGVFRTLALDQSSRINGYAIYDNDTLITYGIYETTSYKSVDRIVDICDWLTSIIQAWHPDLIGIEETQYNPNSYMGHDVFKLLSQVMGAVMLTAARCEKEIESVRIPVWRKHCGVKGKSRVDQKRSAQFLVKQWYDITVTDDVSDAICIGKYFSDIEKEKRSTVIGEWIEI